MRNGLVDWVGFTRLMSIFLQGLVLIRGVGEGAWRWCGWSL